MTCLSDRGKLHVARVYKDHCTYTHLLVYFWFCKIIYGDHTAEANSYIDLFK